MTCKHTISTSVDEDGCCSSCGKDLNPLVEKHCVGCPVLAENARLKKERQRPIAECPCVACGEIVYFYKLGPIRCVCGETELELTVNTTILED